MEYKMWMRRLIFFFTIWDFYGELQGLKEGKKDKFIANKNYSHQNILPPIPGLRIWNHSIKFDHEIN